MQVIFFILFSLQSIFALSSFRNDEKREVDNFLSSFGVDYIGEVRTKYQQLFSNFDNNTQGKRVVFLSTADSTACGYPLGDIKKFLASIDYNDKQTPKGIVESMHFTGCDRKRNFTFIIKREGVNLKPFGVDKFIDELEYLDLKEGETQRLVSFLANGQRKYTINMQKVKDGFKRYIYEVNGTILLNIFKVETDKEIKIEIYYPNVHSHLGELNKRIWLVYNKEEKEVNYRWPNSNLNLSKKVFDQYIQNIARSQITYYYASLHNANLTFLPETTVVATSTSDSQFYRDLIQNIDILNSGQTAPVLQFLLETKESIEKGILVIDEN